MNVGGKSGEQLLKELSEAQQRILELEQSAANRKQAEKHLQNQSADLSNISPEQVRRLLHELEIHQIELEMQNEELHKAQAALEISRTKYFDLYNIAPVGYLTLDKEGLIKETNLLTTQLLGVERSFVVGQPITRFIFRDDQDTYYRYLKKLFDTELPQECELRLVTKDGSQFWVYLKTTLAQEDQSGSVVCQTALIDITEHKQAEEELNKYRYNLEELVKERTNDLQERNIQLQQEIMQRKQAEAALRESEEQFQAVFDKAMDAILVTDPSGGGRILSANPAACLMFGYSEDEILGLDREATLDTSAPNSKLWMKRTEKAEETTPNVTFIRKDRTRFLGELSHSFFQNRSGNQRAVVVIRDITQRNRTEDALRESEARYRSLVESSPDGVIVHRNGRFLYANSVALKMYGAGTLKQLQTKTVPDLIQSDDRDAIKARMKKALVEQIVPLRETKMVSLDGTVIQVETVGSMIDFEGEPAVQIIIRDITGRKLMEQELFEANQRLQALMDALPVGVSFSDDPTSQSITGNPTVLKQFEVNPEDNLSASAPDYSAPGRQVRFFHEGREISDAELPLQRAVDENKEIPPMELEVVLPSGRRWFTMASGAPVHDREGNVLAGVAVTVDITERKLAEFILQTTLQRFFTILSSMYSAILLVTDEGRVEFVNQSFCDRFGLKEAPSDLVGLDAPDMIEKIKKAYLHPEEAITRIREILERGQPVKGEEIAMQDGGTCLRDFVPLNIHGKSYGRLWLHVDITERKRAEDELHKYREHLEEIVVQRTLELGDKNLQLIQAHKMEALGKLAGGIAHDLNNILQPILLNSEMISDKLPAGTQEREYLDQIIDVAQLGRNLIKQIKSFGSSLNPILKPIPISQVVHKALKLVKQTLSPKINLHDDITMNGYLVNADSTQINQLVLNLCTNAAQAMSPKGGTLDVSLFETEITHVTPAIGNDLNPGKYMKLTVSDTGSGIKPEIMRDIFDPFFTTRKSEGTGLGLAIVYEVVKNSQSCMLVYSEVGKGTRFEIFFPLHLDSLD